MKFSRRDTIVRELKHHLPFTLGVSLIAGILVALAFVFDMGTNGILVDAFEMIHPLHIFVSAAATAGIYRKYNAAAGDRWWVVGGRKTTAILIGVLGAILIGTISDVLLPWVAGNLFSLETILHVPLFEFPSLILGVAVLGSLFGIYVGMFKLNHTLHVFFSVLASLFYLLAFSASISVWVVLGFSLVVFLVVFIPCCISDIVFPLFFIKKSCKLCGHWH